MKKQFFILSTFLIICFVFFSPLGVKEVKAASLYPIDYTDTNTQYLSTLQTLWEDALARGYNVNPQYCILIYRANQTNTWYLYFPLEPINQNQSTIQCTLRSENGNLTINMSNWARLSYDVNLGYKSYSANSSLGSCSVIGGTSTNLIVYNAYYTLPYDNIDTFSWQSNSNVEVPVPSYYDIGSSNNYGHSTAPSHQELQNGFTWSPITGSLSSSGHSSNVNPTSSTFDFTNPTQNLLGQINDNTNDLIGHTSSIFSAIKQLTDNVITGFSALFNAIGTLNTNFMNMAVYDEEEVSSAWEDSYCKQFVDTSVEFTGTLSDTVQGYSDTFFEGAGPNTLEIPLDFTNWKFTSTIYGTYKPFNQIYYLRFPFLDETKALWQPILIGLLYFALVTNLYFDLPNILRGAVK